MKRIFWVLMILWISACDDSTSQTPVLTPDQGTDMNGSDMSTLPDNGETPEDMTGNDTDIEDMDEADLPPPDVSPMGGARPVTPVLPESYDPRNPAPLLILLHGYQANALVQKAYFRMDQKLSDEGFIVIAPNGTMDDFGNRFWNATDYCCDFTGKGVDDVSYLTGLIDEAQARFNVDPKRIFFLGHSNGGFMSYRMACELSPRIAGIVSLAGATFYDSADCEPEEPVSVLQIHGTADLTILYTGGVALNGTQYPGAEATANQWVGYNGCDEESTTLPRVDLTSDLGEETERRVWSGCGGESEVALWSITAGSHIPNLLSSFGDAVIDFMKTHPKP